jgi:hypothetical protein
MKLESAHQNKNLNTGITFGEDDLGMFGKEHPKAQTICDEVFQIGNKSLVYYKESR